MVCNQHRGCSSLWIAKDGWTLRCPLMLHEDQPSMCGQTGADSMGSKPARKTLSGRWQELVSSRVRRTQQVRPVHPAQSHNLILLTEARPRRTKMTSTSGSTRTQKRWHASSETQTCKGHEVTY